MSANKLEKIIVTGASSGIGEATCIRLLESGYSVIGLARDFSKCSIEHSEFQAIEIDLSDVGKLEANLKPQLTNIKDGIRALIANAGIGRMGYLEQISTEDIKQTMDTNFLSHAVITKLLLPELKSSEKVSDLVFIGSESALKGGREGSVYCASKFALRGFAQALREECSKSSLRVSLINPGAVRSTFFENLHFEPGAEADNAIEPEDIAQVVLDVITARAGTVFDEINMSPLKRVWHKK